MTNTPERLSCPNCKAPFQTTKTLGIGDSASIRCPHCGHQSQLGDFRRAAAFSQLGNRVGGNPPPPVPPPVHSQPESEEFANSGLVRHQAESYVPRRRRNRGMIGSVADFLDFGFNRYLTPTILKITWFCAIALIVLGTSVEILSSAGAFTSDVAEEFKIGLPSFGFDGPRIPSRSGASNANPVERSAANAAGRIAFFCVRLMVSVLFLLWVRVALEGGIVVFQLAGDVKAIRSRAEHG